MARTALTVQSIAITGLAPSYAAGDAANGHSFAGNSGDQFLHVKNSGGSPVTVTIPAPAVFKGLALTAPTVSVPATSGDRMIGPFDSALFVQADGNVYIDLSGATGVTLAVVRMR